VEVTAWYAGPEGPAYQGPYEYPGDCNTGRVSTAVISGEKIFMKPDILSPDELIGWHEVLLAHVTNKWLTNKFFAHVHKRPPLATDMNPDYICNNNFHFSLSNMPTSSNGSFPSGPPTNMHFCPYFIIYVMHTALIGAWGSVVVKALRC
jgi:hypothetical protein